MRGRGQRGDAKGEPRNPARTHSLLLGAVTGPTRAAARPGSSPSSLLPCPPSAFTAPGGAGGQPRARAKRGQAEAAASATGGGCAARGHGQQLAVIGGKRGRPRAEGPSLPGLPAAAAPFYPLEGAGALPIDAGRGCCSAGGERLADQGVWNFGSPAPSPARRCGALPARAPVLEQCGRRGAQSHAGLIHFIPRPSRPRLVAFAHARTHALEWSEMAWFCASLEPMVVVKDGSRHPNS